MKYYKNTISLFIKKTVSSQAMDSKNIVGSVNATINMLKTKKSKVRK